MLHGQLVVWRGIAPSGRGRCASRTADRPTGPQAVSRMHRSAQAARHRVGGWPGGSARARTRLVLGALEGLHAGQQRPHAPPGSSPDRQVRERSARTPDTGARSPHARAARPALCQPERTARRRQPRPPARARAGRAWREAGRRARPRARHTSQTLADDVARRRVDRLAVDEARLRVGALGSPEEEDVRLGPARAARARAHVSARCARARMRAGRGAGRGGAEPRTCGCNSGPSRGSAARPGRATRSRRAACPWAPAWTRAWAGSRACAGQQPRAFGGCERRARACA